MRTPVGHKKTASSKWGGNRKKRRKRIAKRQKNEANGLLVFSQNSRLGHPALYQKVIEFIHGAKLRNRVAGR